MYRFVTYVSLTAMAASVSAGPPPQPPPGTIAATRACLPPHDTYKFCDHTLPIDERVDNLISMLQDSEIPPFLTAREGGGGSPGHGPAVPRLGLPEYDWGGNCIHGVQTTCINGTDGKPRCPTSFPNPNALGATFNSSGWHEMGAIIGREMRSLWLAGSMEASGWARYPHVGLDCWSPNININRDPRWGRNQEVPSEDPTVNGMFGMEYTVGLQNGTDDRYLQAVVTLKHWDAYSLEDSDGYTRHNFNAIVDNYTLADTYFPAFKMSVVEGGAKGVMCSYNAINGVPTCANPMLNHTLRGMWGFDGYITSDSGAVSDIYKEHKFVSTAEEAVGSAIGQGGCDIDSGPVYYDSLIDAVNGGQLSRAAMNTALHRTIKLRFQLGLFDPIEDQPYWHGSPDIVSSDESQATNLLSTLESMVLLSNPKKVLPIAAGKKVALIGPHSNATSAMVGNYLGELCPGDNFDCVQSLGDAMLAANPSTTITQGCTIKDNVTGGIDAATAAAASADVVVLALGIDESVEGESHDRTNVALPSPQIDLLNAILATNKPIAIILLNGGMLELEPLQMATTTSVLEAWYPGFHGGQAIAWTLYGKNDHLGGKMPITVYPQGYIDQVKMSDMSMVPSATNPGRSYKYYTGTPTVPFGYGISLTTFTVQNETTLFKTELDCASKMETTYTVKVTNTGSSTGDEVVFAFYHPPAGMKMKRALYGFSRVHLAPGESTTVEFNTPTSAFKTVTDAGDTVVVPGDYRVELTNGVDQSIFYDVSLTGSLATLEEFPRW